MHIQPAAQELCKRAHSPAPTIPHSHPPSVGHEQGEGSSQEHCPALGMATAPPAPDQPAGVGSSHPVLHVELLAISEPCNVLKPSGPRDKAPLSSFSFFPEKAFLHNVHF